MDATRKIQVGIHGLSLDHKSMCPGNWVHIRTASLFLCFIHDFTAGLFISANTVIDETRRDSPAVLHDEPGEGTAASAEAETNSVVVSFISWVE